MTRRRSTRLVLLIEVAAALLILVLVNWMAGRHYSRWDWTRSGLYSISDTTRALLDDLDRPLRIVVFLQSEGARRSLVFDEVRELSDRFAAHSSLVQVEYVDPLRHRKRTEELVESYGVELASTVIFEYEAEDGPRRIVVPDHQLADLDLSGLASGEPPRVSLFKGEEAFASALHRLVRNEPPRVVFTSGHGERSFEGRRPGDYGRATEALRREHYDVEGWTGLTADQVPEGTDVLIVAGPRRPFLPNEVDALRSFLACGGRVLFLLDPLVDPETRIMATLGIEPLLAEWGIRLGEDVVVDPPSQIAYFEDGTFYTNRFREHSINQGLETTPVVMTFSRSVAVVGNQPGYRGQVLWETSGQGWAETNLASLPVANRDGDDLSGPVPLAAAVSRRPVRLDQVLDETVPGRDFEEPDPVGAGATRLVVVGDSELGSNGLFDRNVAHFLSVVHWLAGQGEEPGISPKAADRLRLRLTRPQLVRLRLVLIGVLPGLMVVCGIGVWWRRRN